MKGFIEIFGSKAFYCYYEDYLRMIEEYDQETVDAFLNADFDIDDISRLKMRIMDSMTAKKNLRRIS